jgi:Ca2+-binding RTX toxin-like protein
LAVAPTGSASRGGMQFADPVRVNGGNGDDRIRGGPGSELMQAGTAATASTGAGAADGLIGGLGGRTD